MADHMADLPPRNGNFRFLLIDSYFESSDVADQVADIPPKMAILDSYSESSHVADQVADIPPKMEILHSYL